MLRFFTGLIIAQTVAVLIATSYPGTSLETLMVVAFAIAMTALVTGLWFGTVSRQLGDQRIAALQQSFASEREKINQSAQRAQQKLEKKTRRQMEAHERRTRTRANVKVGAAIAVAGGFGLLMMFMQLTTLGLLTMTSVGGAVGGYLMRAKREQELLGNSRDYKMIEGVQEVEQPQPSEGTTLSDQSALDSKSVITVNEVADTDLPASSAKGQ